MKYLDILNFPLDDGINTIYINPDFDYSLWNKTIFNLDEYKILNT